MDDNSKVGTERVRNRAGEPITSEARCLESGNQLDITFKKMSKRESRTRLSIFTFTFHFHALEKEMATHSSVLAWKIPGTGEPGGLPSVGSHRVRHD